MEIQLFDSTSLAKIMNNGINEALESKMVNCGKFYGCINFVILDEKTILAIASLTEQTNYQSNNKSFFLDYIYADCDKTDYNTVTDLLKSMVSFCAQNQYKLKVSLFAQNYLLTINQDLEKICKDFCISSSFK